MKKLFLCECVCVSILSHMISVYVCFIEKKWESASPCVFLLKALQLVFLLSQWGLQIQIGAIMGELQRTVVKLHMEKIEQRF